MLVDNFLQKVKDGDYSSLKYKEDKMSPTQMNKRFCAKLNKHQMTYWHRKITKKLEEDMNKVKELQHLQNAKNRHDSCHQLVHFLLFFFVSAVLVLIDVFSLTNNYKKLY